MSDANGGDGIAMGPTGDTPVETPVPITGDVSSTPEELNLKIEKELGIPHTEVPVVEPETPEEPVVEPGTEAEEPAKETETEEEAPVVPEPSTPSDEELFIEVEDAEGVTHKISKIEDLPEDFSPKNNRQILQIVSQLGKLDAQMEQRAEQQATAAAQAEQTALRTAQFTSWDNEIAELGKEKRLDVADTKHTDEVFKFMNEVNTKRVAAGNPNLISSFEDALDKFEAAEAKEKASDKKKAENDRAKSKASLIGGSSSTGASGAQPYYSGRYRSMDDVPVTL